MPNTQERKLESFDQLLDKLAKETSRGVPVVVEGKNDTKALSRLGIECRTLCVKSTRGTILESIERLKTYSEVIVLTDFDRKGREMEREIARKLEELRVKPNTLFWKQIKGLVGRDVKDLEGLPAYIEGLRRKLGNRFQKTPTEDP